MVQAPEQQPDDDASDDRARRRLGWLRQAGWALFGVLLAGGIGVMLVSMLKDAGGPERRQITSITRITLPPPPPPLPKPPPPEPPKVEQKPQIQEPKQTKVPDKPAPKADKPPPAAPLTAEAGSGANNYGLAVGDGSGNYIGQPGGGGGTGGGSLGFYAGLIQSQVQGALKRDERTRAGRYHLALRLWLNPTGQVTRATVVSSSGDSNTDTAIARMLTGLSLGEAPPPGMAQPVNIRIGAEPG